MAFQHQELTRDGKLLDQLVDEEAGFRLVIARLGAEPVSLARRTARGEWLGFLHRDGDLSPAPGGWNNHATVMGYYVHRLLNESSCYCGHEIRGGTHSFLRHKLFAAPEVALGDERASLTYRIGPAEIASHEYPFRVALALTYQVGEGRLMVTFHFENLEPDRSAHVSFGWHPGFAVESLAAGEVLLPAGFYVRHLAPGNFLSGETVRIAHPGGPMPFAKGDLPGSFLLELLEVPDPTFIVRDGQRETLLDFREALYVTLWSDGGAFVCVEPCWGLPDHHAQRPFEQKLGIQEIPAAGALTRRFTITPRERSRT